MKQFAQQHRSLPTCRGALSTHKDLNIRIEWESSNPQSMKSITCHIPTRIKITRTRTTRCTMSYSKRHHRSTWETENDVRCMSNTNEQEAEIGLKGTTYPASSLFTKRPSKLFLLVTNFVFVEALTRVYQMWAYSLFWATNSSGPKPSLSTPAKT